MRNVIAVFNNRNQTMQFASYLKKLNVNCKTISTPRELSVSCGLSVMFFDSGIAQANFILSRYNLNSFVGFFIANNDAYKNYQRLY